MKLDNQLLGVVTNTSPLQKSSNDAEKTRLSIFESTMFVIAILSVINLLIYYPSIGGFFLADDFNHISYLYEVFHGKPFLLLANFYSNWMQTAGTEFYRPLVTLSLAFDYMFWKNNALGYHLSNIVFQIVSSVLFYLLVQRLVSVIGRHQAKLLALMSAAFFAAYPLHPEVVSWIIGRVDSLATMFYLASFILFLKHEQDRLELDKTARSAVLVLSLICYGCALLSKEIAITLPLAIWLWLIVFSHSTDKLLPKMLKAFKATLPYWLVLGVYLAIRSAALGTFWGGYSGSLAIKFAALRSLFEQSLLTRLVLPFNDELFSPRHLLRKVLPIVYYLAAAVFGLRLLAKRFYYIPIRPIIYGLLWLILSVIPAYQVLYFNPNLQGTRIIYLASLPICFLFSLFLLPFPNKNSSVDQRTKFLTMASFSLCLLVLTTFARTAYLNNLPWRHASDELRQLQQSLLSKAATNDSQKKIVLFNMPHHFKGAHMLYNGYMLNLLCSKEISGHDFGKKIITFEHPLFGDPDLFNMTRLERLLAAKSQCIFVAWQRNVSSNSITNDVCGYLKELNISSTPYKSSSAKISEFASFRPIRIDAKTSKSVDLKISRLSTGDSGLLELLVRTISASPDDKKKKPGLKVQWFSDDSDALIKEGFLILPLFLDDTTHSYLFNLRDHMSWLLCNHIDHLKISVTPGDYQLEIVKTRLLNTSMVIPKFDLYRDTSRFEDPAGVYHLSPKQVITFQYDASRITGAKAIMYEISKSNNWFEHEDQTLNSNHFSSNALLVRKIGNLKGDFEVLGSDLGADYFETHLAAVDKQGHIVGLMSDPVYGQVGF